MRITRAVRDRAGVASLDGGRLGAIVDQLPAAILAYAPELRDVRFPEERFATCNSCAMKPLPGADTDDPWAFTAKQNCCTYFPRIPGWSAGRILRRGDEGAARMMKRMATPGVCVPQGVNATRAEDETYYSSAGVAFGRDETMQCPFWRDEGPYHCTIWRDRNAVCRTWFCKHEDGRRGAEFWLAMREVLKWLETELTEICLADGKDRVPAADAPREAWILWYLWCADHIDEIPPDRIQANREADAYLRGSVIQLRANAAMRDAPMPSVLVPTFGTWERKGDQFRIASYSSYDTHMVPGYIFILVSKMIDKKPWREAVAETEAELGHPLEEGLIQRLYKASLLSIAPHENASPGVSMKTRVHSQQPVPELGALRRVDKK